MGYISTGMGDRFGALLVSVMACASRLKPPFGLFILWRMTPKLYGGLCVYLVGGERRLQEALPH